jgi:hypothetical protein
MSSKLLVTGHAVWTTYCAPCVSSLSYIATDSQSDSLSWCQVPFCADGQILNFFEWQLLSFFFIKGTHSDERMGL